MRPPRRPLRRVLAVVGIGCALAWWGWRASDTPVPPPPRLPAPETMVSDALVPRGGGERLEVRVVDEAGAPLADVLVSTVSGGRLSFARTDGDGRAVLERLVDGPHAVAAVSLDRPPVEVESVVPRADALVVALEPPYADLPELENLALRDLAGRVELPFEGDEALDYEVVLLPPWREEELPPLDGTIERRVAVDADGAFRVDELALGTYDVLLLPPWAAGGRWPALARQSYAHRAGDGDAELVVRARHGDVTGALTDEFGLAVAGALVELVDSSAPTRVFPHQLSFADGTFRFPAVPAGTWRLRVSAGAASVERLVRVSALRSERVELRGLRTTGG